MQIRFLEIAQIELDDSIDYYNSESDGLGDEFLVGRFMHWIGLRISRRHGTRLQTSLADVSCVVFLTESYTRYWIQRFSSLQLRICIGTPTIGKIE
jgi:hypothetical protein